MGDFGCGDVGWTPFMKINGDKIKINPRINSLLIQENVKKRQRGWAKSAGFPWKTSRGACLSSPRGSLEQTFTYILLKIRKWKLYFFFNLNFRVHSITIPSFGATEVLTTLTFRRQYWLWLTREKVTDQLENIHLQDLPRYEDRQSAQIHCHQQAGRLSPLPYHWWEIPQHLSGS